ncbi:MAG: hypothetical protein A2148_09485 [Chloroflexi bacterium RBG_16_68_14]|nr:MAG: hypothetical protein A2148_09485 [Chloroflexi bacterium RBG_16_68_14]
MKTIGAALVGLGLTRLEPLRTFAASSVGSAGGAGPGGPPSGPYSVDSLRARAVETARWLGDEVLAAELSDVCCWAPAAAAIRRRPLALQEKGAQRFFSSFPGGDHLAQVLLYTNNTTWHTPRFRFDPEGLVEQHYAQLQRRMSGVRTQVLTPDRLRGSGQRADLGLLLDRETGERLAKAGDRAEPMWAALSVFSGMMLDPTDDLSQRLTPLLSLSRAYDRALARVASVRYTQVVLGAVQRAVYADLLGGANPALPLVQLSAAGYLPLGEEDGRFLLLRLREDSQLTGYRTESV